MADFGQSLNEDQLQAATFGEFSEDRFCSGPLLIIAGAGTGKTNTLAHRVAHLLVSGVDPRRIALMTFSRRAASEMLQRAERIAAGAGHGRGDIRRKLWAGTFHAIGHRLIREFAGSLGVDQSFSIIDRGDAGDLIDLVRQELNLSAAGKRFPRKDTCLAIYSNRVNTGKTLAETLTRYYPWCASWEAELTGLFRRYVEIKQQQALLDYDDLLLYWHLLMQEPALAEMVGARFDHVLVDEYQDTNLLQAEILRAMKPDGTGVCVVGDDAQSIYSFRSATVDNILDFPDQYSPTAKVVSLVRNYRSVQPILDAANQLMQEGTRRFEKRLYSESPSDQKPRYVMVEDDRAQSDYVVNQILTQREAGVPLKQQAVLMRRGYDSDTLELELVQRDIPYHKYGGLKFLEAAHVKDVLAILRFAENPRNRLAGFRSLQLLPGIGPATAEQWLESLAARAFQHSALADVVAPAAAAQDWTDFLSLLTTLNDDGEWRGQLTRVRRWYEPHLERIHGGAQVRTGDLEQLEALAVHYRTREEFLAELTLDPPQASSDESDDPSRDEDYLILSTVHSAKGQEWDNVFVLNVTDGTFPNEFATDDPAMIEEERRLLYVGMTRAKRDLHLVAPFRHYVTEQRRYGDRHVYGARSRFMTDTLLTHFDEQPWPLEGCHEPQDQIAEPRPGIDAGSRMRSMWD